MGKLKNKKIAKSHLTPEDRKIGKNHVYILVGMIIIGIVVGIYHIQ